MQIRFFTIPIEMVDNHHDELNLFLRTHKVVELEKQLVQMHGHACWCFCISYLSQNQIENSPKEKVDYKRVLEPEIFEKFSRMREIRKTISVGEGVSAFMVFTDAELAEMAKLSDFNVNSIKTIKGIGDKKAEKYGTAIIEALNQGTKNETDRSVVGKDSLF
jgi:superfamily II DNA helicase RecQ